MSSGTTRSNVLAGIAKPIPAEARLGLMIAEFSPTTWPCKSKSGPPEFPGLIAASVWMISPMNRPSGL